MYGSPLDPLVDLLMSLALTIGAAVLVTLSGVTFLRWLVLHWTWTLPAVLLGPLLWSFDQEAAGFAAATAVFATATGARWHQDDLRHGGHELIKRIAEFKLDARKLQLFGLPSLQPEMYRQGVIRASHAAEAVGAFTDADVLFAPANDPFVTAQVVHDRIVSERRVGGANLYLASLGTKPQALGFALMYLTELRDTAASMVFHYAETYERETTKGVARTGSTRSNCFRPSDPSCRGRGVGKR